MIDEEGGVSEVIEADVTNEASCRQAVERTVQLFGTVHILVNVGMDHSPILFDDQYLTSWQSELEAQWVMQRK